MVVSDGSAQSSINIALTVNAVGDPPRAINLVTELSVPILDGTDLGMHTVATLFDPDGDSLAGSIVYANSPRAVPDDLFVTEPSLFISGSVIILDAGELANTVTRGAWGGVSVTVAFDSGASLVFDFDLAVAPVVPIRKSHARSNPVAAEAIAIEVAPVNNVDLSAVENVSVDATGPLVRVEGLRACALCEIAVHTDARCLGSPARMCPGAVTGVGTVDLDLSPAGRVTTYWDIGAPGGEVQSFTQVYTLLPLFQFGGGGVINVPPDTDATINVPMMLYSHSDYSVTVSVTRVGDSNVPVPVNSFIVSSNTQTFTDTINVSAGQTVIYQASISPQVSRHSSTRVFVVGDAQAPMRDRVIKTTLRYSSASGAELGALGIFAQGDDDHVHVDVGEGRQLFEVAEVSYTVRASLADARLEVIPMVLTRAASSAVIALDLERVLEASTGVAVLTVQVWSEGRIVATEHRGVELRQSGSNVNADRSMVMDTDSDGIPTDVASDPIEVLRATDDATIRVAAGHHIRLGEFAVRAAQMTEGMDDVSETAARLRARISPADAGRIGIGTPPGNGELGIYDYVVSVLPGERQASIAIELEAPMPPGPVAYKYVPALGSWVRFSNGEDGMALSAPRPCPAPTAGNTGGWRSLTAGDECLLLVITDGGAYDDDGVVNYVIVDPAGLGGGGISGDVASSMGAVTLASMVLLMLVSVARGRRRLLSPPALSTHRAP